MNYLISKGKIKTFLIGLIVLQSVSFFLADSSPSLYTSSSASVILQSPPSSPINHNSDTHQLGLFELEEEDDRLEDDFLAEEYLSESSLGNVTTPLFILSTEERILSILAPPIYLIDEQFRL